ncbi:EAL domain-containing protein [Ammoniphilus sp. CFH 90114]|uniref:sensor domain-containing protein n=1 Tax=Ammoniphilus sp. CFH 90114 TaxID=2493665 RepID=UPI0010100706|nr:EAL domain-containing protein [Ammoniphilus sp. CFH 90114]RXT07119.1 EAL domain-containing protein [Ammoniphilus sp. CFH 90114]
MDPRDRVIDKRKTTKVLYDHFLNIMYDTREIYFFDTSTLKFVEVNTVASKNLGYTLDELLDMSPVEVMTRLTEKEFQRIIDPLTSGKQTVVSLETSLLRKDSTVYPVEIQLYLIEKENQSLVLAIVNDIIERKQAEEMIHYLSYQDHITCLPNRMLFNDRLSVSLSNAKRNQSIVTVLFLDLDRFKHLNDPLGHDKGDAILRQVAHKLKFCLRENDTISRFGGDEFAIILSDVGRVEDAGRVAGRVLDKLSETLNFEEFEFRLTASIGISLYPFDGNTREELLKNAHSAMYKAKERGGNCYQFYASEMNARMFERLVLENGLHKALDRNEFVLYYQPQYDSKTLEITGVEALVRWNHPDLGLVPPADFIPLSEEIGHIIPLGIWVLYTACVQNKAWQDAGYPPISVSVILSTKQFKQSNLVQLVSDVLNETGLEPQYLKLELTETDMMENTDEILATLQQLKNMGIKIMIDDFGKGYSSLGYLKKFPVDILKIDQSFIREIESSPSEREIVIAILQLAQILDLQVIAEGIETEEQFAFLRKHDCDVMQGYYFSKPLPLREIEEVLKVKRKIEAPKGIVG